MVSQGGCQLVQGATPVARNVSGTKALLAETCEIYAHIVRTIARTCSQCEGAIA